MKRNHGAAAPAVAVLAWGLGNIAQMTITDDLSPVSTIGLRCLVGGLCALPLAMRQRHGVNRPDWGSLARVSALFALAFTLQTFAQRAVPANHTALIGSAESVVAAGAAAALLGETASATTSAGGLLVLATGVLVGVFDRPPQVAQAHA